MSLSVLPNLVRLPVLGAPLANREGCGTLRTLRMPLLRQAPPLLSAPFGRRTLLPPIAPLMERVLPSAPLMERVLLSAPLVERALLSTPLVERALLSPRAPLVERALLSAPLVERALLSLSAPPVGRALLLSQAPLVW